MVTVRSAYFNCSSFRIVYCTTLLAHVFCTELASQQLPTDLHTNGTLWVNRPHSCPLSTPPTFLSSAEGRPALGHMVVTKHTVQGQEHAQCAENKLPENKLPFASASLLATTKGAWHVLWVTFFLSEHGASDDLGLEKNPHYGWPPKTDWTHLVGWGEKKALHSLTECTIEFSPISCLTIQFPIIMYIADV